MGYKTLDGFLGAERRRPEGEGAAEGVRIYLTTIEAFNKRCSGCRFLAKVEELEGALLRRRVFCRAGECVKRL